jgi:ABC-type antimicrobial peptide transport system permease subunit
MGVRVALGAGSRLVWWAVAQPTIRQLSIGMALGLAGAAGVARILPAVLAGTPGADPAVLAAVASMLLASGLIACVVPARRALRLDPLTALRAE